MAKSPAKAAEAASTAVATVNPKTAALPAHLQNATKKASLGNVDQSDLIIPRIKLLQAISPEVEAFEAAKSGVFWHTLAGESMGESLPFIPIVIRKSYTLWAPRGDARGVLARANDALNWDKRDIFKVKLKGMKDEVIWSTEEGTVAGSGLAKFGSSNPADPDSQPAASLTYSILAYFPDFPEFSPAVILNTRSAVRPAKQLISKIELRPVDHFAQRYVMERVKEEGAEGPYWNYRYTSDGYASEDDYAIAKSLYERYAKADFRTNDEEDEPKGGASVGSDTGPGAKF